MDTGPLPLSIFDSITPPLASSVKEAFKSKISDCNKIASLSLSKLIFSMLKPQQIMYLHSNLLPLTRIASFHF